MIKIPLKPLSVNKAWQGRRFKSSYYKQFEKDISKLLPRARKTMKEEIEIHYTFYLKNYKLSDVDNLIKPLQDQLVAKGYFKDDRQIVFLTAEKIKSIEDKIEVEIISYEE